MVEDNDISNGLQEAIKTLKLEVGSLRTFKHEAVNTLGALMLWRDLTDKVLQHLNDDVGSLNKEVSIGLKELQGRAEEQLKEFKKEVRERMESKMDSLDKRMRSIEEGRSIDVYRIREEVNKLGWKFFLMAAGLISSLVGMVKWLWG